VLVIGIPGFPGQGLEDHHTYQDLSPFF